MSRSIHADSPGVPVVLGDLALRLPTTTRRLTALHREVVLRTRGRAFVRWFGASILVLETTGRRSGRPRATPLVYLPDGDELGVDPALERYDALAGRELPVVLLRPAPKAVEPARAIGRRPALAGPAFAGAVA